MAYKTKIMHEGRIVEAEELEFEVLKEPWCEYECEDGTNLRIKLTVCKVVRLIGMKHPNGEPVFIVSNSNSLATRIPLEKYQYETEKDKPPEGTPG